jgi:hypothetical protein
MKSSELVERNGVRRVGAAEDESAFAAVVAALQE